VATNIGLFLLICFLGRVGASGRGVRFLLVHGGLFAATSGGLAALMLATPASLRQHTLQSPFMQVPQVALFYLLGDAYFIYAYVRIGRRTGRYPNNIDTALTPLLRLSLRIVAVAAAGLAVTACARATWVLRKSLGAPAPEWFNFANWQLSNVAFVLLVVGLSLLVQRISPVPSECCGGGHGSTATWRRCGVRCGAPSLRSRCSGGGQLLTA
jgi:hypothetical protein